MERLIQCIVTVLILSICTFAYAQTESLRLEWEKGGGGTPEVFNLYMSEMSGVYNHNTPFAIISYVEGQTTYTTEQTISIPADTVLTKFFVMSAENQYGESGDSNEASQEFDTRIPGEPLILLIEIVTTP